jgi:hypothetical protein
MNFLNECVSIPVTQFWGVLHLAIRTEAANALAEGNMHIQTKTVTVPVRQLLIIFIFKNKGLDRTGQPHSGKTGYDTHVAPIYISGRFSASQK